jgi:hypothetical protein
MGMFISTLPQLDFDRGAIPGLPLQNFLPRQSSLAHVGRRGNFAIPRNVGLRNWESLNPPARNTWATRFFVDPPRKHTPAPPPRRSLRHYDLGIATPIRRFG